MILFFGNTSISIYPNQDWEDFGNDTKQWLSKNAHCELCQNAFDPNLIFCSCCDKKAAFLVDKKLSEYLKKYQKLEERRESGRYYSYLRQYNKRLAEGFYTKRDIDCLLEIQEKSCAYCGNSLFKKDGSKAFEVDHVVPLSKTGTEWPDNLLLSCKTCNTMKGTSDLEKLWKKLRKQKGIKLVNQQKKLIATWENTQKKLTDLRKNEYRAMYMEKGNILQQLDVIIKTRKGRYKFITNSEDIRKKSLSVLRLVPSLLLKNCLNKNYDNLNLRQEMVTNIFKILTLDALHALMENKFSDLQDFKNKCDFEELLESLVDCDSYTHSYSWSSRTSVNTGAYAFDEYKEFFHTALFNKIKNDFICFIETNSEQYLKNLEKNYNDLIHIYLNYEFLKKDE